MTAVREITASGYVRRIRYCADAFVRGGGAPRSVKSIGALVAHANSALPARDMNVNGVRLSFIHRLEASICCFASASWIRGMPAWVRAASTRTRALTVASKLGSPSRRRRKPRSTRGKDPETRAIFLALPKILFQLGLRPTGRRATAYFQAGLIIDLARSAPLEPKSWRHLVWDESLRVSEI